MSPTRTRTALTSLVAATVLLGGALSGCSLSRDDDPPDTPVAETTPLPTPTEDETPTETPTPTETVTATPTASPSAAPAPTLSDALLSAAELPQLNDTTKWSEGRTGSVQPQPFGLCAKFDLLSIGAVEAIDRKFTARGDSAGQQVADFPDAQNALRAAKVVEAWHKTCAQRVRGRNVNVRPITDVAVKNGRGSWYLVSYERQGDGHFHSLGMVLDGPRMTLLRMDHDGQDHNYEPGQDPMQLAVQAASAKLGGS